MKSLIVLLIAVTLSGCVTVEGSRDKEFSMIPTDDPIPIGAPDGMAMVCFYNPPALLIGTFIYWNNERITSVAPGTYSCVAIEPGTHSFEGIFHKYTGVIKMTLEPSHNYYVKQGYTDYLFGIIPVFELMPAESALTTMSSLQHTRMKKNLQRGSAPPLPDNL